ncbi:hypothetical protein [Chthonobacter rhizosphaerae]|uniref:hypothetical protein n=1 Tax=Chthonobacter rhizosphaerae TaxID=2735553 RepID=UPI0015EF1B1D|nr:hypothetical protein [Chthonobacter rhizosphaerae]
MSSFSSHLAAFAPPRITPLDVRTADPARSAAGLTPRTWDAILDAPPSRAPVRTAGAGRRATLVAAGPTLPLPSPVSLSRTYRTGVEAIAHAVEHHVGPLLAMVTRIRWAEGVLHGGSAPCAAGPVASRATASSLLAIDTELAANAAAEVGRLFQVEGRLLGRDPEGRTTAGPFELVYKGALFDAHLTYGDGGLTARVVDAASGFSRPIDPAEAARAWFGTSTGGPAPNKENPAGDADGV